MQVVVIAELGWSIGRVNSDIASKLLDCKFTFHSNLHFFLDKFMKDFRESDVCLTTMNHYKDMITMFPDPKDRRKILLMAHGSTDLPTVDLSHDFSYAVTSKVCAPKFRVPVHITPNGVNFCHFQRREPPIAIRTIGWCGAFKIPVKRFDMALDIGKQARLPVSIVSSLSFDNLKSWYHMIDLLLVTSGPEVTVETGPLPAFEAIASGVPVIGTRVGNFSFVPGPKFSNVEEAVAIIATLTSPKAIQDLVDAQYAYVRDNFEYTAVAPAWRTALEATAARVT